MSISAPRIPGLRDGQFGRPGKCQGVLARCFHYHFGITCQRLQGKPRPRLLPWTFLMPRSCGYGGDWKIVYREIRGVKMGKNSEFRGASILF